LAQPLTHPIQAQPLLAQAQQMARLMVVRLLVRMMMGLVLTLTA
jgi:hypothetical protein